MDIQVKYRGKIFVPEEIEEIRSIIEIYRDKSLWFISREICRRWNWTQPNGILKDMICRGLLNRLESLDLIKLPPKRRNPLNYLIHRRRPENVEIDQTPLWGHLPELRPIELIQVRRTPYNNIYNGLIERHHYLRYVQPVGEHLKYIAFSKGRPIACLGFSSVPRHIGCRDRYIGWDQEDRKKRLHLLAVNTRFLILPWIRVPYLASHLLGLIARHISYDWERIYNHPVVWLETFVDPERGFKGTCYKAANWIYLGETTGRGKDDQTHKPNRSIKIVFGYPLKKDFHEALCGIL